MWIDKLQEFPDRSCTYDSDCLGINGEDKCAIMTMEGYEVVQCVAPVLCGETMELEGV